MEGMLSEESAVWLMRCGFPPHDLIGINKEYLAHGAC